MLTKLFEANSNITKRLYYYSLLFFTILLPFQPKWLPLTLGMMLFGVFWLLSHHFKSKFKNLAANKMVALFFLYFFWILIGSFYSPLKDESAKEILSKIPFLIWPLLLGSLVILKNELKYKLLFYFVLASLISVLYCIVHASLDYFQSGLANEFFFIKLVEYKMIPPHYLGMYISFAYGMVLYAWFAKRYFIGRNADFVMMMVFLLGIVLISVRIQFVVIVMLTLAITFFHFRKVLGNLKAALISLAIIIFIAGLIWSFPGSRNRLKDTYHEIVSFEQMVNDKQTNHRKFLWMGAWDVIEDNFWLGAGTGAGDRELQHQLHHVDKKFWDGKDVYYLRDKNYNVHNVFLQHWADNGLIGFIIILSVFLFPLFRFKDPNSRIFLFVCFLSFMTESMLERQAGVLFFSFFYSVFFIMGKSHPSESEPVFISSLNDKGNLTEHQSQPQIK